MKHRNMGVFSGVIFIILGLSLLGFINFDAITLRYLFGVLLIVLGVARLVEWSQSR